LAAQQHILMQIKFLQQLKLFFCTPIPHILCTKEKILDL